MIKIYESSTKQLNIFQDKTRVSDYDAMMDNSKLKRDATQHEYYKFEKGYDYTIEYMTAQEYMDLCSDKVFDGRNAYNGVDEETVDKYAESMRNGDKFPLPYINVSKYSGQEGRHRMLAGAKAFGENTEFPVMIIFDSKPTESEIIDYCKKAYGKDWNWAFNWVANKFGHGKEKPQETPEIDEEEFESDVDDAFIDDVLELINN